MASTFDDNILTTLFMIIDVNFAELNYLKSHIRLSTLFLDCQTFVQITFSRYSLLPRQMKKITLCKFEMISLFSFSRSNEFLTSLLFYHPYSLIVQNTLLMHSLAVYPAALAGRERFIIIIYNITHSTKHHPSPTLSFLRHRII